MTLTEKIVTGAALFISCLALFVSIMQTKIMSQQKDASVWPYLQLSTNMMPTEFSVDLDNVGVGPAKIKEMHYELEGKRFGQIQELVRYILKKENLTTEFRFSNLESGNRVLLQGDSRRIVGIADSTSTSINSFRKYASTVKIYIKYCSIYDKCWVIDGEEYYEVD